MDELVTTNRIGRRRLRLIILLLLIAATLFVGWRLKPRPVTTQRPAVISVSVADQSKVGQRQTVPINIDTAGQTINAAEVYLLFDPQMIEVQSVSVENSILSIQLTGQPAFSNQKGEISFAGGLPNPGFSGQGQIGNVTLVAKKAGKTSLRFDSRTQALLNDGAGTVVSLELPPVEIEVK